MKPLSEATIIIQEFEGGRMSVEVEMRPEVDMRRRGGLCTVWGRAHKAGEWALEMLRGLDKKRRRGDEVAVDTTDKLARDIFKKG